MKLSAGVYFEMESAIKWRILRLVSVVRLCAIGFLLCRGQSYQKGRSDSPCKTVYVGGARELYDFANIQAFEHGERQQ